MSHEDTLIEREPELEVLAAAVGATLDTNVVVIEGAPGVGKTRLLDSVQALARQRGMLALVARCTDLERLSPYGVVQQLADHAARFAAQPRRYDELSGIARQQLSSYAETDGEPLLYTESRPPVSTRLAALVNAVAAREPVLLLVDDLQWADEQSLTLLAALAAGRDWRRVVLVVTVRSGDPAAVASAIALAGDGRAARVLRPRPLTVAGCRQLLTELIAGIQPGVSDACYAHTGGNPLLLRQLAGWLRADGAALGRSGGELLGSQVVKSIERNITLRLNSLSSAAREFAQAMSVLRECPSYDEACAVSGLDRLTVISAVAELVAADVLTSALPLRYVHEIVRAAVYARLTSVDRLRLHSRAASVLAQLPGADLGRVASHLLSSPPVGQRWAVDALLGAARVNLADGHPESACAYLARSLEELTGAESAPEHHRVLGELGLIAGLVDLSSAAEYLRTALQGCTEATHRAELSHGLAQALLLQANCQESLAITTRAIDELPDSVPVQLRRQLHELRLQLCFYDAKCADPGDRARLLGQLDGLVSATELDAAVAMHAALAGQPAAVPAARRSLTGRRRAGHPQAQPGRQLGWLTLLAADQQEVMADLDAAIADAGQWGARRDLAIAHACRATGWLWRGDLARAEFDSRTALELADSTHLEIIRAQTAACLAEVLIEQGRLEAATSTLDLVDPAPAAGMSYACLIVRARLHRLGGDYEAALESARGAGSAFEAFGGRNPAFASWRSEAAYSLSRTGDVDQAQELADEEIRLARQWGCARTLGHALRIGGVLAGQPGIELLQEAVAVLEESNARLAHAHALADLGATLRRTNRRGAARQPLRQALELALNCGAMLLVGQVRNELAVTGERVRAVKRSGENALSPQERRVAALAAARATNLEIAQALHISPKTVKDHLSSVYRKLGVSRRRELTPELVDAHDG